jgi:hypothetical protein
LLENTEKMEREEIAELLLEKRALWAREVLGDVFNR